jgi:hypothetical protein
MYLVEVSIRSDGKIVLSAGGAYTKMTFDAAAARWIAAELLAAADRLEKKG